MVPGAPVPPSTHDASEPVSPPTADVAEPVPPPDGEAADDVKPELFGGNHVELSLLPLYPNHIAKHI